MKNNSRVKDLETIRDVFEKFGVRFFVVYGAALGFHRDGDFIPHDDDIDLAVVERVSMEKRKGIGWMLYDLGFNPQPVVFFSKFDKRPELVEPGYNGDEKTGIIVSQRNFKFTIFFFHPEECSQHGMEYVCTPRPYTNKLIATPMRFYENPKTIKINGKKYNVPSPIEEYLDFTYFNNWKDKEDRRHGQTYPEMHATVELRESDAYGAVKL